MNKIAANLAEKSRWKKQEILDFVKKSTRSVSAKKSTTARVHAKVEKKRPKKKPPLKLKQRPKRPAGKARKP